MQQNLKLNPSLINNLVRFQIKIAYWENDAERPANPLEGKFLYQKTCWENKIYRWWCSRTVAHCSSVHGISQARIPEWVAVSFSRGSSWPRDRTRISCFGRQIWNHSPQTETWTQTRPTVFQRRSHLVSGPNETQILDVSSQKEFSERQSDR